jgi:hypothetical protein
MGVLVRTCMVRVHSCSHTTQASMLCIFRIYTCVCSVSLVSHPLHCISALFLHYPLAWVCSVSLVYNLCRVCIFCIPTWSVGISFATVWISLLLSQHTSAAARISVGISPLSAAAAGILLLPHLVLAAVRIPVAVTPVSAAAGIYCYLMRWSVSSCSDGAMLYCPRLVFPQTKSLGQCVPWTRRPLDKTSFGRAVLWTRRHWDDAFLRQCVPDLWDLKHWDRLF